MLSQFRPFLEPLYEAFESATVLAHEVIEHHGWRPTAQLFSHIARAEVKRALDGKACPVEYDDKIRVVQMDHVSMEGLATTVDDIAFKIMKGEFLPPPLSAAREYFYQHSNLNLWSNGNTPQIASLVVLWECDLTGKSLSLYLACPKDGSGQWLWRILIPPPAQWIIVSPSSAPDGGDSDLDISREEPDSNEQQG